jgi:hypothetical protein
MAKTDWRMEGLEYDACNCNWGCPCQFNAPPTQGHCSGTLTMQVEHGYFGGTKLDGLIWGLIAEWPGAIHEGNGRILYFADDRATPEQRHALQEISAGRHSNEGTLFHILSVVCPTILDPVFALVEFEYDLNARTAKVRVPGLFDIDGDPIRNPVTGEPDFPRLVLPKGFEFKEAEFSSANTRALGPIRFEKEKGHAHFARICHGPEGYIG